MPTLKITIQLATEWPTPEELDARNAIGAELDEIGIGENQGAGAGRNSMDLVYEVENVAAIRERVADIVTKHLPKATFEVSGTAKPAPPRKADSRRAAASDHDLAVEIRERNLASLRSRGLEPDEDVPLADERGLVALRPVDEIARRLMASTAVVAWACAPEDRMSSDDLRDYIENNELTPLITSDEMDVLEEDREDAKQHCAVTGWMTENDWSLAWALGFDPAPAADGSQVPVDVSRQITFEFVHPCDSLDAFLDRVEARPVEQVIEMEDLLCCAHATAWGTALDPGAHATAWGAATAPGQMDVEVIRQRRHALAWCLSPGVDWDDIELPM